MLLKFKNLILSFLKKEKFLVRIFCLFIISPILTIPLLFYCIFKKDNTVKKIYIVLFSFALAFIAYHTLPGMTDDLMRHFDVINKMQYATILDFFKWGYDFVWVNSLLMFIVYQLNNPSLYPLVLTFVGYYIIIDLFYEYYKKSKVRFIYVLLLFIYMFLMIFFKVYVLSLRNYVSFLIGIYTLFLYTENRITARCFYLFYLIAFFIHPSVLVIMLFYFMKKICNKSIEFFLLCMVLFHRILYEIAYYLILKNIDFYIFEKLHTYLLEMKNQYNLNMCILFVFTLFLLTCVELYNRKKSNYTNKYLIYSIVLTLSTIYQFELFRRFMYIVIIFSIPTLFQFIKNNYKIDVKNIKFRLNDFLLFSLIVIIITSGVATYASISAYGWYFDVSYLELIIPILSYI